MKTRGRIKSIARLVEAELVGSKLVALRSGRLIEEIDFMLKEFQIIRLICLEAV